MTDKCPFLAAQEDARGWTVPPDNVEEMHKKPCLHCKVIELDNSLLETTKTLEKIGKWIKHHDMEYYQNAEDDDILGECLMDHYPGDSQ